MPIPPGATKKPTSKSRKSDEPKLINVVFTLNNPTQEEEFYLLFLPKPLSFLTWGKETGGEGTPHLQGYLELSYRMRLSTLHRCPGLERAHFEARRGSQREAIDYCHKDGDYFVLGTPRVSQQGKRWDLDDARRVALESGMREVTHWGSYQQIRCAEKYLEYNEPERCEAPLITWLWGPTGCGKSRAAREVLPDAYRKSTSTKWWMGYDGQRKIILDDFCDSWMTFTDLLSLLDRYGHVVETKGGYRQFQGTDIVITCSRPPEALYANLPAARKDELLRRINLCIPMGAVGSEVEGVIVEPLDLDYNDILTDLLRSTTDALSSTPL